MGRKPRLRQIDGSIIGQLDKYVDDGLGPDAVDCRATYVMDCVGQVCRQNPVEHGGLLAVPVSPAIPVLHKFDGKELPEFLEGHVSQGLGHK